VQECIRIACARRSREYVVLGLDPLALDRHRATAVVFVAE
jgi:hypothetical protein